MSSSLKRLSAYRTAESANPSHFEFTETSESAKPDVHIKVVVVGDGGCGKTCLLVSYSQGVFPERYIPTVFENYITTLKGPKGEIIELALWDTAGQEEYDRLRPLSYPDVDVLLVCYSVDSPSSFENVAEKWFPEVTHFCPDAPVVLVCLKTDLRNDATSANYLRQQGLTHITPTQGRSMANRLGVHRFMECSSKDMSGVREVFAVAMGVVLKEKGRSKRIKPVRSQSKGAAAAAASATRPKIQSRPASESTEKRRKKKRHQCLVL